MDGIIFYCFNINQLWLFFFFNYVDLHVVKKAFQIRLIISRAILGIIVLFEAARRTTGYFIPGLVLLPLSTLYLVSILWVFSVMQGFF